MTDTCSCPPDDCHGGHTINIGPPRWWGTNEQIVDLVQRWTAGENVNAYRPEVLSMAAEVLALRARVTTAEAEARCRPWSDFKTICQVGQELADLHARADELQRERDEARADAGAAHGKAGALQARVMELQAQVSARDKRITELEAEAQADGRAINEARDERDEARAVAATREADLVALVEAWEVEANEHRRAGEFGIAEGLKVAIDGLREVVQRCREVTR